MIFKLILVYFLPLLNLNYSSSNDCGVTNTAVENGETLVYKIYYNWNFIWIGAGEVVFRVTEEETTYKISAIGTTYPSYDWFFKVRDRYETVVNKADFLPISSVRDIQEGKFTLYDSLLFNRDESTITSYRGKNKDNLQDSLFEADQCIQDILSIIYYARNLNYEERIPAKIAASIFIDRSIWPLEISVGSYKERHKIKGLGVFSTLELNPNVKEGFYFKKNTDMKIWVTQDEQKIPLLIETPISVGSLKVILKETR
ncbi:MAG: DUF3108 domain-containing protein [Saprospiraceae bacterium]